MPKSFFFKNHAVNHAEKQVPHSFLFLFYIVIKNKRPALVLIYFGTPRSGHTTKKLSFFLLKGLGIASPPHLLFCYSRNIHCMIYFIGWQNIIVWLYVLIMSRTRFKVNPPSIVAWMSRNSLLEIGAISEV